MYRSIDSMPQEYQKFYEKSPSSYVPTYGPEHGEAFTSTQTMYMHGINVPLEEMGTLIEFKRKPNTLEIYQENGETNEIATQNNSGMQYQQNQVELAEAATKGYTIDTRTNTGQTYEAKLQYQNPNDTLHSPVDLLIRPKGSETPFETVGTQPNLIDYCSDTRGLNITDKIEQIVSAYEAEKAKTAEKTTETHSDFPSLDDLKSRAQSIPHKDTSTVESTSEKAASLNPEAAKTHDEENIEPK